MNNIHTYHIYDLSRITTPSTFFVTGSGMTSLPAREELQFLKHWAEIPLNIRASNRITREDRSRHQDFQYLVRQIATAPYVLDQPGFGLPEDGDISSSVKVVIRPLAGGTRLAGFTHQQRKKARFGNISCAAKINANQRL